MEDIAEYALNYALSHEANYAEVRLQRDNGSAALLKNGNPEVSSLIKNYGIGIRVLVHGSMGFVSTNILAIRTS